jgi:hypothetical protein
MAPKLHCHIQIRRWPCAELPRDAGAGGVVSLVNVAVGDRFVPSRHIAKMGVSLYTL